VVDVNFGGASEYVEKSTAFAPLLLDAMLDLSDHEGGEENKPFRTRNEAEGLVRDDAGFGGEMSERHPEQKETAKDVQRNESDTRFLARHGISGKTLDVQFGRWKITSLALRSESSTPV
jgi:hypothetical protein